MTEQPQLQALATVAFTVSELAAIVSAVETFSTLLTKIQTAAPDVWAEVTGDYASAIAQWNAALRGPVAPNISASDAAEVVNASGQLAGMPTDIQHAIESAGPTLAVEPAASQGADVLGVGRHVQAAPADKTP